MYTPEVVSSLSSIKGRGGVERPNCAWAHPKTQNSRKSDGRVTYFIYLGSEGRITYTPRIELSVECVVGMKCGLLVP